MLAGTPYHRPAALAASKLRSGCTSNPIAPQGRLPPQPFPGRLLADTLLRCERANARLRSALTVPPSDPDHAYTCARGLIKLKRVILLISSATTPS
eukprot:2249194-Pleurochrysis_carterae.AAC.5